MAVTNGTNGADIINWRNHPLDGNGDNSHGINGLGGDDILYGAWNFPNLLEGGAGNDTLYGGYQDDMLHGGDGSDQLEGNLGTDYLVGGIGFDTLIGGWGSDFLRGNQGNDVYKINFNDPGIDTIQEDIGVSTNTGVGGGLILSM